MEVHVANAFLGATLINSRGDKRKVIAAWLEANGDLRPVFTVLTTDAKSGYFYKMSLPETHSDWSVVVP